MTKPIPCPVCREPDGFHIQAGHVEHQVPVKLTWKTGEKPPWEREDEPVEPAHMQEDAAAILSVLKGLSEQDL